MTGKGALTACEKPHSLECFKDLCSISGSYCTDYAGLELCDSPCCCFISMTRLQACVTMTGFEMLSFVIVAASIKLQLDWKVN